MQLARLKHAKRVLGVMPYLPLVPPFGWLGAPKIAVRIGAFCGKLVPVSELHRNNFGVSNSSRHSPGL